MQMATPEQRACLDFAFRMVVGIGLEEEVYVCRDGITLMLASGVERVEPSGSHPYDILIHLLAKAMQAHLAGVDLTQVRHDLVTAYVGELLADKVQDHLSGCSVAEWERLRQRVAFYIADDNTALNADPTAMIGVT
jgi:hypothetical protein